MSHEEPVFRYAKRMTLAQIRTQAKRGNVLHGADIHIEDDGVRVAVPVYDPCKDETMVCAMTVPDGRVHVYRTLQAAKNALHRCGIEHYTIVRDGVECWS